MKRVLRQWTLSRVADAQDARERRRHERRERAAYTSEVLSAAALMARRPGSAALVSRNKYSGVVESARAALRRSGKSPKGAGQVLAAHQLLWSATKPPTSQRKAEVAFQLKSDLAALASA